MTATRETSLVGAPSVRRLVIAGVVTAAAGLLLALTTALAGLNSVPEGEDRWWFAFRDVGEVAFVAGVVVAAVALAIGAARRGSGRRR